MSTTCANREMVHLNHAVNNMLLVVPSSIGSVLDPHPFQADPEPAQISMRIRIQRANRMGINADPDLGLSVTKFL